MNNLIKLTLSNTAWIMYNKFLAKTIGIYEAILIGELISKRNYYEKTGKIKDGWFFSTQEEIEKDTTLSIHQQRKAIKTFESLNFLEKKREGLPARYFYRILDENIIKFLEEPVEYLENSVKTRPLNFYGLDSKILTDLSNKIKINNKEYYKNNINVSKETSKSSTKKIRVPIKNKEALSILEKINTIGRFNHIIPELGKPALKLLSKVEWYLLAIKNHHLSRTFKLNLDYKEKNNINFEFEKQIQSWNDVEKIVTKAVKRYSKIKEYGYWPENKSWLPKSMDAFFYNFAERKSWFLYCLHNRPKLLKQHIETNKLIDFGSEVRQYIKGTFEEADEYSKKIDDFKEANWDYRKYMKKIRELFKWYVLWEDALKVYNQGEWSHVGTFLKLLEKMKEFADTWESYSFGNFGYKNKTWSRFCKWMDKIYGVELEPASHLLVREIEISEKNYNRPIDNAEKIKRICEKEIKERKYG